MFASLRRLRDMGYVPETIFDIGAHHGIWTASCKNVYPTPSYHLIEAIDYPELNFIADSNTKVYNYILNDTAKEVEWYEMCNTGDSMFKELNHSFKDCKPVVRDSTTLDLLCKENSIYAGNTLIKIDCQGAEIPILKGASELLKHTDFIILELPFFGQYNQGVGTFLEHLQFMDSIGFIPYDLCDNHYIYGFNMQIDMIFIRKDHPFTRKVQEFK
jgi:FkbM family methyltransferase